MGPEPITMGPEPIIKHYHKKNGHVRFSRAYAYACVVAFSD